MKLAGSALGLLLLTAPAVASTTAAFAADGDGCAQSAYVSWHSDVSADRVLDALVTIDGCPDGTAVDLQLTYDDKAVPASAMKATLVANLATFDLRSRDLSLEPLTAVQVTVGGAIVDTGAVGPASPAGRPADGGGSVGPDGSPTPGRPDSPGSGATPPAAEAGPQAAPAEGVLAGTEQAPAAGTTQPREQVLPLRSRLPFTGAPVLGLLLGSLASVVGGWLLLGAARSRTHDDDRAPARP